MQHSTGTLTSADPTPTAPLPQSARDAMRRLELALTTPDPAIVEKVRTALGFPRGWRPDAHLGETATYVTMWSQIELNALFERVGGTVTTRQVERSTHDGGSTWTATELTLTVDVPDVGPVEVATDIEDDPGRGYRTDIPVVAVTRYEVASARTAELSAAMDTRNLTSAEFDALVLAQDTMAAARAVLTAAGQLHLIEVDR